MIISGLDERVLGRSNHDEKTWDHSLDFMCNLSVWWLVLSFTLIFIPLFAKTYKLSRIFTELLITAKLDEMEIHNQRTVAAAVAVDILLLIIFTSLSPFERVYRNGDLVELDELRVQKFVYGTCSITDSAVSYAFYVCIGVWKLVEMVFGIYVSIVVSRMTFKSQIWMLIMVLVVFCIDALLLTFGPKDDPNFQYSVYCVTTLLVVNMVMFRKTVTKWWIRRDLKSNDNSKYDLSDLQLNDEERMKKMLIARLQEIAKNENWVREISGTASGVANETIHESDETESAPTGNGEE